MSQRTAAALASIDELLATLEKQPPTGDRQSLLDETQALRRAVAAFHMEAIRFRMYSVDRNLHLIGDPAEARQGFEHLRQALETAGFHTRSHSAP